MRHFSNLVVLLVCVCVVAAGSPKERNSTKTKANKSTQKPNRKPNIVIIITDDQDVQLGSLESMPRTLQHFRQHGVEFRNAFVTTPLCCPSRTSLLTGTYAHNNGVSSNDGECGSKKWREKYENKTFASLLQDEAGYATAYFGKYLNRYDGSYVPHGWSNWTALKGNSRYYNYTLVSSTGGKDARPRHEFRGSHYETDYLTDLLANRTLAFIRKHAARADSTDVPFLAVMSVPAPHGPETAAPRYAATLNNVTTHRTESFNTAPSGDKQWILAQVQPMSSTVERYTDALHARRLETLRSVDDAVERLFEQLTRLALLDNTYVFYVSDNGFHLGQFGLIKGKLTPFEFDSRVPLLVRTPSSRSAVRLEPVLNIDIMPTILDLAGVSAQPHVDGTSFARLLGHPGAPRVQKSRQDPEWREAFLIERGNYSSFNLSFSSLHFVDNIADSVYTPKSETKPRAKSLNKCNCNLRTNEPKNAARRSTATRVTLPRPVEGKRGATSAPIARYNQPKRKQRSRTNNPKYMAPTRKVDLKDLLRPFIRDPAFTDCLFGNVSRAKDRQSQSPLALNRSSVIRCVRLASSVSDRPFVARLRDRLADFSKSFLNTVITQLVSERQRAYAGWKQALKTHTRRASTRKRSSNLRLRSPSPPPAPLLTSTSARDTSRRVVKSMTTIAATRRPVTVIVTRATNASTVQRARTSRMAGITTASTARVSTNRVQPNNKRSAALTTRSSGTRSRSRREANAKLAVAVTSNRQSQPRSTKKRIEYCARKCNLAERREQRQSKPCYQPDMSCMLLDTTFGQGDATPSKETQFCYCSNSNNSSYACLRVLHEERMNFIYCEFMTGFVSYFDMLRDPHQLNNLVSKLNESTRRQLHKMVGELARCAGSQCNSMQVRLSAGNSQSQPSTGAELRVAVSEAKPTDSGTRSSNRRSTAASKQTRASRGSRAQTKPASQKRGA